MGTRAMVWVGAWIGAAVVGWACGGAGSDGGNDCPVGGLECPCTGGGACDPGLVCIADACVLAELGTDDGTVPPTSGSMTTGVGSSSAATASSGSTSVADTTMDGPSSSDGGGLILDVASPDAGVVPTMGCQAIDMLFVIDGSASMLEERAALAATGSFTQIITTLEGLNGGGIDYRIAVTDDDDHGMLVPPAWAEPNPWFDSQDWTAMEIATHFNAAVGQVGALGGAALGCEHVLTSGTDLLSGDMSGFVRDDALLVLVMLTDVDDYGAYDQQGGNVCGIGCTTPPPPLADLYDDLVALKGGAEGLGGIVVAGDPLVMAGVNICGQPGSCGCGGLDCAIFHATRLYQFTDLLGANGYAADLCTGAASVPLAVETALTTSIELACENFEPEG